MENLDLEESSGYQVMGSDGNSTKSSSYSKEDFMICYGNIFNDSDDTWKLGLELYDRQSSLRVQTKISIANTKYIQSSMTRQKSLMATIAQSSTQQMSGEEQTIWKRGTSQNP
jgi:hypothetical protein